MILKVYKIGIRTRAHWRHPAKRQILKISFLFVKIKKNTISVLFRLVV